MAIITGELQDIQVKNNENKGRWKKKITLKVNNLYLSAFDQDFGFNVGDTVTVHYTENGIYKNIQSAVLVESGNGQVSAQAQSSGAQVLSKEDYWNKRAEFEQNVQFPSQLKRDALNAAIEWIKIHVQVAVENGEQPMTYTRADLNKLQSDFLQKIMVGVEKEEIKQKDGPIDVKEEIVE